MFNKGELLQKEAILNKFICKYQLRHLEKYQTPLTISFLVTNQCNLNCKHCFNTENAKKDNKDQLSLQEYQKLADSMGFFTSGLFCGGEPFIRKDLADIILLFQNKCNMQWASTTTNGQLMDVIISQTEKICSNDPNKIFVLNFSLDGFREHHEWTRGQGTFDKCVKTIRKANELKKKYNNLQVGIVTTMTANNEETISDFFKYISEELEPDVISLLLVRQSPRCGTDIKNVKKENYIKANKTLRELFIKGKNGKINNPKGYYPLTFYDIIERTLQTEKREFLCYAGVHGVYIDYNGNVNPCEVLADKNCSDSPILMGNLREYDMDFLKLWNSKQAMEVRQKVNRHNCCTCCTHETEGILPSINFEPNSMFYKERMKKIEYEIRQYQEKGECI